MSAVVITGSRRWSDRETIHRALAALPPETLVIEGGAIGADRIAREEATALHMRVYTVEADWGRYGRAAGPIRNGQMLGLGPVKVLAFPLPQSIGTVDCVKQARALGIRVFVHAPREGAYALPRTHAPVAFPVCGRAA